MKTSDFKFLVMAVLCLLLVIPILGYVQKQAALAPHPSPGGTSLRERRWAQREALRSWMQHNTPVAVVTISPDDPHDVEAILKPEVTHAGAIAMARRVRMVMMTYFHEGTTGAVTHVTLQSSQGQDVVSVVTGLPDQKGVLTNAWHIVRGHKVIQ